MNTSTFSNQLSRGAVGAALFCMIFAVSSANGQDDRDFGSGSSNTSGSTDSDALQDSAGSSARMGASSSSSAPNARIISDLERILSDQARMGKFPSNSAFLSDIKNLITKYSAPSLPSVKVYNQGPGDLRIVGGSLDITLRPGQDRIVDVGRDKINLVATYNYTRMDLNYHSNGGCRYWDVDDRRHHTVDSRSRLDNPFTLNQNSWGYHLER